MSVYKLPQISICSLKKLYSTSISGIYWMSLINFVNIYRKWRRLKVHQKREQTFQSNGNDVCILSAADHQRHMPNQQMQWDKRYSPCVQSWIFFLIICMIIDMKSAVIRFIRRTFISVINWQSIPSMSPCKMFMLYLVTLQQVTVGYEVANN
jgi:hypothetical protein